MIRDVFSKAAVAMIASASVLFVAATVAQAQVKPFKVSGAGILDYFPTQLDVGAVHTAVGQATHLGRYEGFSIVTPRAIYPTDPLTADFDSDIPFEFKAVNGDTLAYDYDSSTVEDGGVTLFDNGDGTFFAVFIAEFTLVGTEGRRFANVIDSSFVMIAITEDFPLAAFDPELSPGIPYSWDGEGTIEYAKGKKK